MSSLNHFLLLFQPAAKRRGSFGISVTLLLVYGLTAGCDHISGGLTVSARAVPGQEWVLQQSTDGEITGSLTDHLQGRRLSQMVLGSERGDRILFEISPGLSARSTVTAGDTIGRRISTMTARRQLELQGQLDIERAHLALARSGNKASKVREARVFLSLARAEAEQQRRELARQRSLFERNLVAPADLELAESAVETADLRIHMAEAQLQTARTGSREQEIAWIEARIADLLSQLEQVHLDMAANVVVSPISGRYVGGRGDTLALVRDTTVWAAVMPVSWDDHRQLRPGLDVEMRWNANLVPTTGQLTRVGNEIFSAVDGRQFVAVVARLDSVDGALLPGLIGQCRITSHPHTWFGRLQRILAL